ncbi:MAG: glycosyltransferase family 39 protein [bacterium]
MLYFLIPILVQSIILIILILLTPDYPIGTDFEKAYYPLAKSIMNGNGYCVSGKFNAQYPPGYPLFLILPHILSNIFNVDILLVIRILNIIILSSSVFILFRLVDFGFGKKVGFLTAYLWMIYPFSLWLLRCGYSEIPFVVLILLALFFTIKIAREDLVRYSFLIGLMLGISTLFRPIALLWFLIPTGSILFLRKINIMRRLLLIAIIIFTFIIILIPWEIYVYKNTGDLVIVSKEGWTSIVYGITFGVKNIENIKGRIPVPEDILNFMRNTRELDISLRIQGEMLANPENLIPYLRSEFLKNPSFFIKLFFYKLVRVWFATEEMWYEKYILIIQVPLFILFVIGFIISLKYFSNIKKIIFIFLSYIIYFWIMTTIALSILRIMLPSFPIVLIFVSIASIYLFNRDLIIRNV